jgi:hypothetical protein
LQSSFFARAEGRPYVPAENGQTITNGYEGEGRAFALVWNLFALRDLARSFRLLLFVRSREVGMSNGTQIPFGTGGPPAHSEERRDNGLLLSLPPVVYGALKQYLSVREFGQGRVLWNTGDRPSQLYFPQSGLISIRVTAVEGQHIETGSVSREGVAGIEEALGECDAVTNAIAQIGGMYTNYRTKDLP